MLMDFEKRLEELSLIIPEIPPAAGSFIPATKVGNLIYCSGQGPFRNGCQNYVGKVGADLTLEQGYDAASICVMNLLAEVCSVTGSINNIKRIVQVRGFINSYDDFHDQPKVLNGASDLLLKIFGDAGKHVRCAFGTNNLPDNIPVEVEMIVEVVA